MSQAGSSSTARCGAKKASAARMAAIRRSSRAMWMTGAPRSASRAISAASKPSGAPERIRVSGMEAEVKCEGVMSSGPAQRRHSPFGCAAIQIVPQIAAVATARPDSTSVARMCAVIRAAICAAA